MPLAPTPRPPRLSRIGTLVVLYGALLAAAVAWRWFRGDADVFAWPGTRPDAAHVGAGVAIGLAFGLFVVFLSRYAVHRLEWARALHREFRHLLGPLEGSEMVAIALASSVGEEALFRGALQPVVGIWISSALFGLPHIGPGAKFLPWTVTSFLVGLAMAYLFQRTGNLAGPIASHFLINLLNLRYIARRELV